MLAILAVTMFTAGSLTVVFYLRAAGMIEENYSGILYGRMQQTVKDLDESLKEIYYVDTRAAWDEALRENVRSYIITKNEDNLDTVAELLRNHRREYKDINSLYFVFPGEKMAVTSEEFPVNKQGLAKKDIQKLEEEYGITFYYPTEEEIAAFEAAIEPVYENFVSTHSFGNYAAAIAEICAAN